MICIDEFNVENVIIKDPQYFSVNNCYLCKIYYKYSDTIEPLRFTLSSSKSDYGVSPYSEGNGVIYGICFTIDDGERINDIFKEIYEIFFRKRYESNFDAIIQQGYLISEEECKFPVQFYKGNSLLFSRVSKTRTKFINISNQQDLSWNFVTSFGINGEPCITIADIRITTSKKCEIRLICNEL